ncbi:hypothetical protein SynNOUM97013_01336 [Synechococcus sp. NOUM97013]|nr:hypothetical protein SynNOUM97013_01336 [Synechococcus sp. NOUM97013]
MDVLFLSLRISAVPVVAMLDFFLMLPALMVHLMHSLHSTDSRNLLVL